jgi:hypothetical protein
LQDVAKPARLRTQRTNDTRLKIALITRSGWHGISKNQSDGAFTPVHRVQNGHFSQWMFANIENQKRINPESKQTLK